MRKIKIERIDKKQKILLISTIIIIGIVATLVLITSKAKYKNIQSIDLASGTINYTPADIDVVAINIENESGNYENSTTIPSSGYTLSGDSYCNANGVKDTNVVLTYQNGKVGASNITKRIKCYLYFDKYSAIDTIIGDTAGIEEKTEFTGIATEEDTGIYSAPDDYGISYYFRGLEGNLNNWVKFAGFYWRIIRINGNGTIRLIYSGVANGNVSSTNKAGTTTIINETKYMYNHTYNDNAYVGYMMGIPLNGTDATTSNTTSNNSTSYEEAHTNTYNSDAKSKVDSWYKTNIDDKGLSKYIDVNTGFCNDRQADKTVNSNYIGDGYKIQQSAYSAFGRIGINTTGGWKTPQTPTFHCSNKTRDLFTIDNSNIENKGNKKLTYPVGLITGDEVVFAGGFGGKDNTSYYLYTNQEYWTMTPSCYSGNFGNYANIFYIHSKGYLNVGGILGQSGIRPVINLRDDTRFTGSGSESDPFIVV